jgi:hypothetical protein
MVRSLALSLVGAEVGGLVEGASDWHQTGSAARVHGHPGAQSFRFQSAYPRERGSIFCVELGRDKRLEGAASTLDARRFSALDCAAPVLVSL